MKIGVSVPEVQQPFPNHSCYSLTNLRGLKMREQKNNSFLKSQVNTSKDRKYKKLLLVAKIWYLVQEQSVIMRRAEDLLTCSISARPRAPPCVLSLTQP